MDEATGKLVSTDMTQKIGIDEIKSGRDKKLSGLKLEIIVYILLYYYIISQEFN